MAQARTHGANARMQSWDEIEEAAPQRTGSWLPLDALTEEALYAGTPQLRSMPATRRQVFSPIPQPQRAQGGHAVSQQAVAAQPKTRAHQRPQERPAQGQAQPQGISVTRVQARTVAMAAGIMLGLLALYIAVSAAIEWTQVKLDDFQYGRPRTSQIDAYVGHSEAEGTPSHFIAMNLNRRVTVMELPGGDSTRAATIVGPYLFGQGEDLTPVQLGVQDLNGDGKADLVVSVKNEQLLYLNDGGAFKLATPEEQAAIQKSLLASNAQTNAQSPVKSTQDTAPEASK